MNIKEFCLNERSLFSIADDKKLFYFNKENFYFNTRTGFTIDKIDREK